MGKDETLEIEGIVIECLPNAIFKVETEDKRIITAHLSGKMRKFFIKILPGDKVTVEVSPYEISKGRITYRHKTGKQ